MAMSRDSDYYSSAAGIRSERATSERCGPFEGFFNNPGD